MVKYLSVSHWKRDIGNNKGVEFIGSAKYQNDTQPVQEVFALLGESHSDDGTIDAGPGLNGVHLALNQESEK